MKLRRLKSDCIKLKEAFCLTFSRSKSEKYTDQNKDMLQSRALLVHGFLTLARLIMMICGNASWQRALKFIESSQDVSDGSTLNYNASFVSESKVLAEVCLWVLAVVGLILDILCFKWISIANFLFYHELLFCVIAAFIPCAKGVGQS